MGSSASFPDRGECYRVFCERHAILYATSLRALPEPRPLGKETGPRTKGIVVPSDSPFRHLYHGAMV